MGDAFDPEPQGAFMSALDWLDRWSGPVKNVLRGNFAGAGRQTVDLLGDVVDAPLPGDWIHHLARPEDKVDPSELLGINEQEHPFLAGTTNFIGNVALNPSTYVPGGVIAKGLGKAGKVVAKAADMLPAKIQPVVVAAKNLAEEGGKFVRKIGGAENVSKEGQKATIAADAAASNVGTAGMKSLSELFKGSTVADQEALGEIGHNIVRDPITKKPIGMIDPTESLSVSDRARKYLETAPPTVNRDLVQRIADQQVGRAERQFAEGQSSGQGGNIFYKAPEGAPKGEGIKDYFPRQFSKLDETKVEKDLYGNAKAYKGRKLDTQGVIDTLTNEPGTSLEFNALKALGTRVAGEARLAKQGSIGAYLTKNPAFAYASDAFRKEAQEALEKLPPEEAGVMKTYLEGQLPERNAGMNFLAKAMKPFKAAAVYGAIIPRIAADTSNALGGTWQTLANAEARGQTLPMLAKVIPTVLNSIDDGIEKIFGGRVGSLFGIKNELAEYEQAAKASGGTVQGMLSNIQNPTLRSAVEHGVLGNNFISTEQMISDTAREGAGKLKNWLHNVWDMPATIFQGVEQRLRYGLYKGLLKTKPPEEAARIVLDTMFNYAHTSVANRTARDVVPFFQFAAKSAPQSAKFLADKPGVAVGLAQFAGLNNDKPLFPYMAGKLNLPIGKDEEGNDEYISGFRLPFESLTQIPNPSADQNVFGRQLEQNVVGSLNPLLKTLYSTTSQRDPYFATQYGSYDKIPGIGHSGDLGREYNKLAGTGLIQSVDSPLRILNTALDDRHSPAARILDLLTGVNVTSVDSELAIQKQLQELLANNPQIAQHISFYDQSNDPETKALLEAYQQAKARVKAKRQASQP
jgi:hypothetical protein